MAILLLITANIDAWRITVGFGLGIMATLDVVTMYYYVKAFDAGREISRPWAALCFRTSHILLSVYALVAQIDKRDQMVSWRFYLIVAALVLGIPALLGILHYVHLAFIIKKAEPARLYGSARKVSLGGRETDNNE